MVRFKLRFAVLTIDCPSRALSKCPYRLEYTQQHAVYIGGNIWINHNKPLFNDGCQSLDNASPINSFVWQPIPSLLMSSDL